MKLTEVVDHFLIDRANRAMSDGTIALYRRVLGLLVRKLEEYGAVELEDVTILLLRKFLQFLSHSNTLERYPGSGRVSRVNALSPLTISVQVKLIKAFFRWCVAEDLIDFDPSARLAKPKVPERVIVAFRPEHIDALLAACDTTTNLGFRDYVIVLLLLDTGIRVSELCDLRISNVYPRYIKVLGKGRKEREIGMHSEVSKLLWKYIHKYCHVANPQEDHVFVGHKGPLTVSGVEDLFDRLAKATGITDVRVSPHTLRHTFAKWYLKNGGEIFKLSRELGHSGVQITGNTYLGDFHSSDARLAHEDFSPISSIKRLHNRRRKDH